MDINLIWKPIVIIIIGILFLRLSGRRSISQMTISQTVIMISIGTLLIQPVSDKNIWTTFGVAALLIGTLIIIELIQLKWDFTETFFTGKSKIVIENGKLNEKSLKKLRLSVDNLEMRLRQNGIDHIEDLQWATIEPSGQLGYSFIKKKKWATKEDIVQIQQTLNEIAMQFNGVNLVNPHQANPSNSNLFSEIKEGHNPPEEGHIQ